MSYRDAALLRRLRQNKTYVVYVLETGTIQPPKTKPSRIRALLVLGRVSNLPTVWSNCLAALFLGGDPAISLSTILLLCVGSSLLYIGGMYLNDAFDAEFDRKYRTERPIPSGAIALKTVWMIGTGLLLGGFVFFAGFGVRTTILAAFLIGTIVLYDAVHKKTILSPLLMAACRVLLYLAVASAVTHLDGWIIWHALVLGLYIVGLSYIAKAESAPGPLRYWPIVFLTSPIVLAYLVNDFSYRRSMLVLGFVLLAWIGWSLKSLFDRERKNIGVAVSGLLAGIVLVDLLALGSLQPIILITFGILFVAARLFQRVIPAT